MSTGRNPMGALGNGFQFVSSLFTLGTQLVESGTKAAGMAADTIDAVHAKHKATTNLDLRVYMKNAVMKAAHAAAQEQEEIRREIEATPGLAEAYKENYAMLDVVFKATMSELGKDHLMK